MKPDSGKFCSLQKKKEKLKLERVTKGKVAKSYRELGRKYNCEVFTKYGYKTLKTKKATKSF